VRHGFTAETVIGALEDAEDYEAFEAAITADYEAQSAVERELVSRLASVLWRLRRATTMETGLFEIQAEHLRKAASDAVRRKRIAAKKAPGGTRHFGSLKLDFAVLLDLFADWGRLSNNRQWRWWRRRIEIVA
jgi:hypothetical protein